MTCRGPAISVKRTDTLQQVRRVPDTVKRTLKQYKDWWVLYMKTYMHTYILDHISLIYSSNSCTDNQNTYFVLNNFSLKIRAVYEILWQNMVQQGRPQMTIKYGACALHATNAHSEYVILIPFPLQQWLHERVSMLCNTYITCYNNCDEQTCATDKKTC